MNALRFLPAVRLLPGLLAVTVACAQDAYPSLKQILSPAEWQRAGLDQLTPDQIGVIDAALIRHHVRERRRLEAAVVPPASPEPPPGATAAEAAVVRSRFWDKFGLNKSAGEDWRSQPPMKAKVTAWQGTNRFVLDTGQVWEGLEKIPFELLGREVVIEARPLGSFALKLDEGSMSVRVKRVH